MRTVSEQELGIRQKRGRRKNRRIMYILPPILEASSTRILKYAWPTRTCSAQGESLEGREKETHFFHPGKVGEEWGELITRGRER